MSETLRKGWCPGALRPMAAKDGLLVRLRITGGILSATTALALAELAATHGNGLFDLSARGNLQIRGVSELSLPALQDGLQALGLLDSDDAAESIRNVIASPLAGLQDGLDIRPLVHSLELRLTQDEALHALPGKFGFLVDDGSWPSLAGIDADVRFDWLAHEKTFSIGLAGTRGDAVRIGFCDATGVVARAASIGLAAIEMLARCPDGRRMRDAVASLGADTIAWACGASPTDGLPTQTVTRARDIVGLTSSAAERLARVTRRDGPGIACFGLAAPFGRLDSAMLRRAAHLAATTPLAELRLTPWRILLVPGISDEIEPVAGFITDNADPRLAIAACVGSDGCTRGTTVTQTDAALLAAHIRVSRDTDVLLHVSGCPKGCAKPSPSPFTLVGREGRYDLVRDGRAGDLPVRRSLDLETLRTLLEPA